MYRLKIYNLSRLTKYGILVIPFSNAKVSYIYCSLPCTDEPEEPNQIYAPGTDKKMYYLVDNLSTRAKITGEKISIDRYFMTALLRKWLLDHKITVVGTKKENRVECRLRLENWKKRLTVFAYKFVKGRDKMLIPYIDKKNTVKKNILALTTIYDTV